MNAYQWALHKVLCVTDQPHWEYWWEQWWWDHALHGPGFIVYMVIVGILTILALAGVIVGMMSAFDPEGPTMKKNPQVKAIEADSRQSIPHWCQGCNYLIEREWMKWDCLGKFRCLTCVDGTSVPRWGEDYNEPNLIEAQALSGRW